MMGTQRGVSDDNVLRLARSMARTAMSINDRGWLVGSQILFVFGFVIGMAGAVASLVDYKSGTVWFSVSVPLLMAAWLMKP